MTLGTLSLQWNAATYLQPPSARCGHICVVIDKLEVILNIIYYAKSAMSQRNSYLFSCIGISDQIVVSLFRRSLARSLLSFMEVLIPRKQHLLISLFYKSQMNNGST